MRWVCTVYGYGNKHLAGMSYVYYIPRPVHFHKVNTYLMKQMMRAELAHEPQRKSLPHSEV